MYLIYRYWKVFFYLLYNFTIGLCSQILSLFCVRSTVCPFRHKGLSYSNWSLSVQDFLKPPPPTQRKMQLNPGRKPIKFSNLDSWIWIPGMRIWNWRLGFGFDDFEKGQIWIWFLDWITICMFVMWENIGNIGISAITNIGVSAYRQKSNIGTSLFNLLAPCSLITP